MPAPMMPTPTGPVVTACPLREVAIAAGDGVEDVAVVGVELDHCTSERNERASRAESSGTSPCPPKLDRSDLTRADVITQRSILDVHRRHSITEPFEKPDQLQPGRRCPVQVDLQAHLLIEMIGEHFERRPVVHSRSQFVIMVVIAP